MAGAYHKFVKTTPKPSATKKSSGELDPLSPRSFVGDGVALFVPDKVGIDEVEVMFLYVYKIQGSCGVEATSIRQIW